jgi:zinc protease
MKVFIFLLAIGLPCFGQTALPKGVTKVTSVEGITEYQLANGLRLLVFPDSSKPTITVNMTYMVGSRHEGAGEGGMAHLLEHMVFKGSPKHPNIPQELTEHGASPNGSTNFDRTNYYETFQGTDENLKWALDLEADRMVNSFIRKSDLDKEFTVVRNEFERSENNPMGVLYKHVMAAAYTTHSYGRPVIGNRADVERVPIENLQAFYRKYYQPDNAVLTVAGKVDEARIVAMVNDYFGGIPRPTRVLTPTYTTEPTQHGERTTTVRRVGDNQSILAVYHIPDGGHPDNAAINVLAGVLGEPSSGRLYKALVDNKKATQVFAGSEQLNEPGVLLFGAVVNKNDDINAARDTLLETLEGVIKEPPNAEEVQRAKTRQLKQMEMALTNSTRIGLELSEYLAAGDWRLLFLERDRLKAVTPADVQRVAKLYLKSSNRTMGQFIPEANPDRTEIPPKTDLAALLKDYKGEAVIAAGEAFDPSPKNIESRVQRYQMPDGLKVSMLEKKTRGNTVHAIVRLRFGNVENLRGLQTVGSLTGSLLIRGTAKKSRQQIQDAIDQLKLRLNVSGNAMGASASMETTRENLPAALRLAAEILKEAALPEAEFEQIRKQQLTALESARNEPGFRAGTRLMAALMSFPKDDVRANLSIDERLENLKAVKIEQVRKFHQAFYGASHGEVAIIGDFDAAAAKKVLTEEFGSWKSAAAFEIVKSGYAKVAPINESIETPDKQNASFVAALRLDLTDKHPDYPALAFGNFLLGGGFLNSRLATRIRVNDGLSYSISSGLQAGFYDNNGIFQGSAIAAPQNVAKVEAAFLDEISKALKDGFTPKELEAGKAGWIQSEQVHRSNDTALASQLAQRDFQGRTLAWDEDFEKRVLALTPEVITAAMRRHIDPAAISIVKAGDFAKAAAAK